MNHTLQTIIAAVSAIGGLELIKYLINLKPNKAKARAEADAAKQTVLNDYAQSWKQLCDKQSQELDKSQKNIDKLHKIVDNYRVKEHDLYQKITTLSIDLKEAEFDKCEVRICVNRIPPRHEQKKDTPIDFPIEIDLTDMNL